jgi:hypothetical protein
MADESEFVRVNSLPQPAVAWGGGIFGRIFSLIPLKSTRNA